MGTKSTVTSPSRLFPAGTKSTIVVHNRKDHLRNQIHHHVENHVIFPPGSTDMHKSGRFSLPSSSHCHQQAAHNHRCIASRFFKQHWYSAAVMTSCRRCLGIMDVAAVVGMTLILTPCLGDGAKGQGPLDTMVIYNNFVGDLAVQCERRVEETVHPQHAYQFSFDPTAQSQLQCSFSTLPGIVPPRSGRFVMWIRDASFKPCEHICIWHADPSGLSIIDARGFPVHIYSWA